MYTSKTIISFVKTVEHGTLAAAAQYLGVSAAAVGQNITRLENTLGVKLFFRTTRDLTLTDEGKLLYQRANAPIKELEEINHIFAESRNIVSGEISISCTKKLCENIVLELATDFAQQHPEVSFSFDSSDAVKDIQRDSIDIAFRIGSVQHQTIIARKIGTNPLGVYCSPVYQEKYGVPETIEDLLNHNCLQYVFPGNQLRWIWQFNTSKPVKIDTSGNFTFNDPAPMVEACRKGLGLIQTDRYSVSEYLREGSLVSVLEQYSPAPLELHLCYGTRERLPLRVRKFIDYVVEQSKTSELLSPL